VQYFGELEQDVVVHRNDEITLEQIAALAAASHRDSPGPCTPNEAGHFAPLIGHFRRQDPDSGVCLGHQGHRPGVRAGSCTAKRSCTQVSAIHHTRAVCSQSPQPISGDALSFAW